MPRPRGPAKCSLGTLIDECYPDNSGLKRFGNDLTSRGISVSQREINNWRRGVHSPKAEQHAPLATLLRRSPDAIRALCGGTRLAAPAVGTKKTTGGDQTEFARQGQSIGVLRRLLGAPWYIFIVGPNQRLIRALAFFYPSDNELLVTGMATCNDQIWLCEWVKINQENHSLYLHIMWRMPDNHHALVIASFNYQRFGRNGGFSGIFVDQWEGLRITSCIGIKRKKEDLRDDILLRQDESEQIVRGLTAARAEQAIERAISSTTLSYTDCKVLNLSLISREGDIVFSGSDMRLHFPDDFIIRVGHDLVSEHVEVCNCITLQWPGF